MNNGHFERKNLMRRIDVGAARLNPGLSAIAIVLLTLVTAEAATRIGFWAEELEAQTALLTIDPAALTPSDVPPGD